MAIAWVNDYPRIGGFDLHAWLWRRINLRARDEKPADDLATLRRDIDVHRKTAAVQATHNVWYLRPTTEWFKEQELIVKDIRRPAVVWPEDNFRDFANPVDQIDYPDSRSGDSGFVHSLSK